MDLGDAGVVAQILSEATGKDWRAARINTRIEGHFNRDDLILYLMKKGDNWSIYATEVPLIGKNLRKDDLMFLVGRLAKQLILIPPDCVGA